MAQTHIPNPLWRQAAALIARRRFVKLASLAGLAVLAVSAVAAIAVVALGDTRGADVTGGYGGTAIASADGGALRAPEEAAAAPAFDAKGAPYGTADLAGGGAPLPSIDAGRTIIRSGGVDITVAAVSDAFEQIRQIATALGGYVGDSTFSGSGDRQSAYLTIRVPADRFGDAIAQIRGLAVEVQSISTSARDVTEEYRDVEATLRNLHAVEQRYVDLLSRAGSIGDILQVQDRLNQVRLEIDRTEARRLLLASQADLATITVSLRPVGTVGVADDGQRGPLEAAADAWQASLDTLTALATGVLVVVVYSWWIVPPALLVGALGRRIWRRRAAVVTQLASD